MTTLRRAYNYSPINILVAALVGIFIAIAVLANPLSVAVPLSAVMLINTGFSIWLDHRYRNLTGRTISLNAKLEQDVERTLKRVA